MVVRVLLRAGLIGTVSGGDIRLVAGDRLNPVRLAFVIELERSVHVSVVGQRQGGHSQLFGPLDQPFDLSRAVQKGIMGMDMQMGKRDEIGVGFLRRGGLRLGCLLILLLRRSGGLVRLFLFFFGVHSVFLFHLHFVGKELRVVTAGHKTSLSNF